MSNYNIRAYERPAAKSAPLCAVTGCTKPRYHTYRLCYAHQRERLTGREAGRPLTARECRLNAFAGQMPSTVFVWHQDAAGEFVGISTVTPDGIRIGVQTHEGE